MSRHVLVVHTRPLEGREEEFNAWYDEVHLPDVLAVEGFVSARRFRAAPSVHGELPEHPFLAIYEIEADDLAGALLALRTAARQMEMSPALDRSAMATYAYSAV
jgi:hypothetical protein